MRSSVNRIIGQHIAGLAYQHGFSRRQMPRKPALHLFPKFVAAAEAYVYEGDGFAVQRIQTRHKR